MRATTILFFFLPCLAATAQPVIMPPITKYFSARTYDRFQGETRLKMVQKLQDNNWQALDSIYGSLDRRDMQQSSVDLAPYVNEEGNVVYWVTDVAPQFPGGNKALEQYIRDVAYPYQSVLDKTLPNTVYVRCTINPDGQVTDVGEATAHRDWLTEEMVANCLDAVRYMPTWTPGLFKGKPVRVQRLILFSLND